MTKKGKVRVSIVAPARNEERNLREYVQDVEKLFKGGRYAGELIIVDDQSTDSTFALAKRLAGTYPFVRVLQNARRGGITGSWLNGMKHAKYGLVHFSTSDLESLPSEDVPRLIPPLLEGYDLSVAQKDRDRRNPLKVLLSSLFSLFLKVMFGVWGPGWVKAARKNLFSKIPPLRHNWHRYIFPMAVECGLKVKEVKTRYYVRKKGSSNFGKVGLGRGIGAFKDVLSVKKACAEWRESGRRQGRRSRRA